MAAFVQAAKHPFASLTHHGLIKLIILRTLAQHNITWEQFIARAQEPAPLPGVPMEQEQVQLQQEDRSPSNIVGGRDETASEGEKPGAQLEQLGEDVDKNLVENPDNKAALTAEGEIRAALNAVTIEPEGDRAREIE